MKGLASLDTVKYIYENEEIEEERVPDPFWCKNSISKDEQCCFWHYIFYPYGGPERDDVYHPVYEYEQIILDELETKRTIAVYKATGLGITEFVLLWILWKCWTDPFFADKDAIIVTGPNIDLAQGLIRRTKAFIRGKLHYVDNGSYGLTTNGCRIRCYPSNNIHSARGIPKVSVFFGDEAAFFTRTKDDNVVRTVGERYIGKSNSYVIWVSTAGEEVAGFFYDIKEEKQSIYNRMHFYVEWGLKPDKQTGKTLYSPAYIKEARKARSFPREYLGEWGHDVGDIFPQVFLDKIFSEDFDVDPTDESFDRVCLLDPGFGTSGFGVMVAQKLHNLVHIIYSRSFERESFSQMLNEIDKISRIYRCRKFRCDNQWPEGIKELREKGYDVVGYSFKEYGNEMTNLAATNVSLMKVVCHPALVDLKSQLSTIRYNKKGMPDKSDANTFDEGDCFLMANWYFLRDGGVVSIVY